MSCSIRHLSNYPLKLTIGSFDALPINLSHYYIIIFEAVKFALGGGSRYTLSYARLGQDLEAAQTRQEK